jgi:hypothetical protein
VYVSPLLLLLLLLLLLQELTGMWEANVCHVLPGSECELLYGAAGYLYSLTWLQTQLGADVVPPHLCKVGGERQLKPATAYNCLYPPYARSRVVTILTL